MGYDHVLRAALDEPWAIEPAKGRQIATLLALKWSGGEVPAEVRSRYAAERALDPSGMPLLIGPIEADEAPAGWRLASRKYDAALAAAGAGGQTPDGSASVARGLIAVLPLYGVITHREVALEQSSSTGTSAEKFGKQLQQALAMPAVAAIILDIDSPGGGVGGVAELATQILSSRKEKPIVAVANSMAASAAYWIGTAAGELVVTPSGEVGSIGVFAAHKNIQRALEMEGVEVTLISAGRYKTERNPYGPLSDDAKAAIQVRVDEYYEMFVGAVAQGRGVSAAAVRDGFGQGRMVGADQAVSLGMADARESLDDVIRRLSSEQGRAEVLQRSRRTTAGATPAPFRAHWLPDAQVLGDLAASAAGDLEVEDGNLPINPPDPEKLLVAVAANPDLVPSPDREPMDDTDYRRRRARARAR